MSILPDTVDRYHWWASLKHGGLLIAPSRLAEIAPDEPPPLARRLVEPLRRAVTQVRAGDERLLGSLLDTVLEEVLGLSGAWWLKGNAVGSDWSQRAITGEVVKPRRVWKNPHGPALPVFVQVADGTARLGIGRGRRDISRVIEWLRKSGHKIALLTNGRHWRLIHAGADYDAWCEWDIDFWFEGGEPGPQVTALQILLGSRALTSLAPSLESPLIAAIQGSRRGQAEVSGILGERVRKAVELLIRESSEAIAPLDTKGIVSRQDLYIAATRIIMRCVVILFAEARDLLPRENPVYHASYGMQGLREQLDRLAGGHPQERLHHTHSAWPRLLALFRLVCTGSAHEALPVPRYGGALFAPGDSESPDPVERALAAFEDPIRSPSDAAVYRILNLLTRSRTKVRQGRGATWVEVPVDFSDLSSEYIGILYEGLLDYELRRADADDPVIFLNLGDQPALPLGRLEAMDDEALAALVEKLNQKTKQSSAEDAAEEGEEGEEEKTVGEEDSEDEEEGDTAPAEDEEEGSDEDVVRQARERAHAWAVRAVKASRLVAPPRANAAPDVLDRYDAEVNAVAERLVAQTVLPGQWYLVRWGGTRKGAGTYYTRPQLAVPTTHRTLQPLAYDAITTTTDPKTGLASVTGWAPKAPEEILALKVCDPAMGSGSFLIAALRFLTDALQESLHYHGRIQAHGSQTLCRLADGRETNALIEETLPVPPDDPAFEDRLKARLKRYVVERCLYGVDLDPLAVELGRLALWVETMDRSLPFGFLDHKIKCGNALVGCWFDRFQDYPVMAWEREGGDKNHTNFVHHFREYEVTRGKNKGSVMASGDGWTQAIKEMRNEIIKPEMVVWITAQANASLSPEFLQGYTVEELHDEILAAFQSLHELPVYDTETRAELYWERILNNPAFRRLKEAFDTWCAIWFWPGDRLDVAPTPKDFYQPGEETRKVAAELAGHYRFFHWELEFPDVFVRAGAGFDAVLGNPPWEIQKPNSKEFFSNIDPLYRAYGNLEALSYQRSYYEHDAGIERDWLAYRARFKALSNWVSHVAFPFGDEADGGDRFSFTRASTETNRLHTTWRRLRSERDGYTDQQHPFRHQGSADLNSYKLFLETSYALLHEGGRLGMIVPSGVYTDKGATALRTLFLSRSQWEWLFGFENRQKIFDIDSRAKFCPVIVQKGGETGAIRAAFMHRDLQDWEEAERHVLAYPRERIEQFSPGSRAILELRTERDLAILEKMYASGVLLGDPGRDGWGIRYAAEFHMTSDSTLFPPRPNWEKKGYRPDEYGHWLKGNWRPFAGSEKGARPSPSVILSADGRAAINVDDIEDIALPLYEGRMIGQFDFSQKGWVSGKGRGAVWRAIDWTEKVIEPQFLMSREKYIGLRNRDGSPKVIRGPKVAFMDVTSATNERTMIATFLFDVPCGNSAPVLETKRQPHTLAAILNSFAYDYVARARCGGSHLNYFVIEETVLPLVSSGKSAYNQLEHLALRLDAPNMLFAREWLAAAVDRNRALKCHWAITLYERLRLRCILDAIVAELYGLEVDDFAWIMRDCDYPVLALRSNDFTRTLDPKGFWRVDKEQDPELRHSVLSLVAFHELKRVGLDAFLTLNAGEGWMLPETLRLADYGLGHDDRAKEHQPVAARLGPRFLPWQLEGTAEESWEECKRQAENLRRLLGDVLSAPAGDTSIAADQPTDLFGNPVPTDLFGDPVWPQQKRRR